MVEYERPVEVAQMLVRHNADTNSQDHDGKTPLHLLSESQIDETCALNLALLLLKHGAKLNTRDKHNQTPLHLAVRRGRSKLAVIFLEHGADATAEDNKVRSVLHALLSERQSENDGDVINLTKLLLRHGAGVNKRDKDNHTPLYLAVRRDRTNLAAILLEHGAEATAEDIHGKTPLHVLSESRDAEGHVINLALLLLKHGAELNARDKHHQTPLLLAVRRNRSKLAVVLLEQGADATAKDNNGRSILHTLLSESWNDDEGDIISLLLLLLEHGAQLNTRDKHHQTPLHLAVRRNRTKLAVILLERGADATAEDNNGRTVLHTLISESRNDNEGDVINIALLLLEHGAGVNRQDKDNESPLHLALKQDCRPLSKLAMTLLEHSADANAEDNNGNTPLSILVERLIHGTSGLGHFREHKTTGLAHDTEVNRQYKDNDPPELDADDSVENKTRKTPVHQVLRRQYDTQDCSPGVLQPLSPERGVDIDDGPAQDESHLTPSHLQSNFSPAQIVQVLLDHGANPSGGGKSSFSKELKGKYHTLSISQRR